ncbi:DgyrCDS13353 [Dimorphilus gyrociliatus]|uniref:Syntaxin-18 n=1 Tax=Dimorphilus gyrociliatus TaxID=2664684 RepID=A0A7I8WAF3_9ANNE|nr:DgyrCDS13353 [Dimorphilus gyrociliatus]
MIPVKDLTSLFEATVKTVKTRRKLNSEGDKTNIFPRKKQLSEFSIKAKSVVKGISELQNFLQSHREDYTAAGNLLKETSCKMTEEERNQIDLDAQKYIITCKETIKTLETYVEKMVVSDQAKEHYTAVIEIIEEYLKSVCNMYSSQRAVRLKKMIDKKQVSRLKPSQPRIKSSPPYINKGEGKNVEKPDENLTNKKSDKNNQIKNTRSFLLDDDDILAPDEEDLLKQENVHLLQDMNSLGEEVKNIEGQVVEISRLQAIFTEKILEQEQIVNHTSDNVIGSSENIKDANDEIRQAMKNNAGLRVWILFFLIVSAFSLLFLDWYNP